MEWLVGCLFVWLVGWLVLSALTSRIGIFLNMGDRGKPNPFLAG